MKHRFTISAKDLGGALALPVSFNGESAGRLLMPRDAASAFVEALLAGDIGLEGSGAQVEIIGRDGPEGR